MRAPLLSALVVWLAACGDDAQIAANEAIVVVPDPQIDGRHRDAITFAAEGWNLEFGTQLSVADFSDGEQVVSVSWEEGDCTASDGSLFAGTVPFRGRHIKMCPQFTRGRYADFFETMRHELGHVLGLEHGRDVTSIMGVPDDVAMPGPLQRAFRPEDRLEFARVNPNFAGSGGCSINRVFAERASQAAMVISKDVPYAVWSHDQTIAYAAIDPSTGGRASDEVIIATGTSTVAALAAHPTGEGFVVSWSEVSGIYRTFVSPSGAAPIEQLLEVPWNKPSEHIVSTIYANNSHYLAIAANTGESTRLLEVGDDGTILTSTAVRYRGALVRAGDGELFFTSARLSRLKKTGDRFELQEQLELAEDIGTTTIRGAAINDGLLVLIEREEGTTMLRVSTSGALVILDRRELGDLLRDVTILDLDDELLIAGWRRPDGLYTRELHTAVFARNLEPRSEWARISGVDQIPGGPPWLFLGAGRLLLSWSEGAELRTRCRDQYP